MMEGVTEVKNRLACLLVDERSNNSSTSDPDVTAAYVCRGTADGVIVSIVGGADMRSSMSISLSILATLISRSSVMSSSAIDSAIC